MPNSSFPREIPQRFNAATAFVDNRLEAGQGDRVAIHWGEKKITYGDLARNVNRTGNALRRLGIHQGDRLLLVLLDSPEFAYSFFGAIKIGAIPVSVNTYAPPDDYVYLWQDSQAVGVVLSAEVLPAVEPAFSPTTSLRHRIVVGKGQGLSFWDLIEQESDTLTAADTHRDEPAFWLYSSGSTGRPKGVIHRHGSLPFCVDAYARPVLGLGPDDITLAAPRLFFAYGLGGGMYFALGVGGGTVLLPERPTPQGMYAAIHKYRPTVFFGVPTLYASMLQVEEVEKRWDLSSLRLCVSAGEALPGEIYRRWQERFGVEILDGLGTTEALHIFLSNRPREVRSGSSGKPVSGYEIRLVDEQGREVEPGEIGDLLVKGQSLAAGYWQRPEATRRAFFGEWLRTGDKYYQDKDGYFWCCGRSDDMLKVSGQWVSPAEVEGILFQHPAVLEAAVVGQEDENKLIKPKAFVVLQPGHTLSPSLAQELQTFVREKTLPHKYPRWVEFVAELPKTTTGKIQRYKLRTLSS
jgi:benzoate-CoA ligase